MNYGVALAMLVMFQFWIDSLLVYSQISLQTKHKVIFISDKRNKQLSVQGFWHCHPRHYDMIFLCDDFQFLKTEFTSETIKHFKKFSFWLFILFTFWWLLSGSEIQTSVPKTFVFANQIQFYNCFKLNYHYYCNSWSHLL